jgi:hypothetical protein
VRWLLLGLVACGAKDETDPAPPPFPAWFAAASARCFPAAEATSRCDDGVCVGILRAAPGDELDLDCLHWPYVGKGTQRLTQTCGDATWRLTGITQLPPMDPSTAEEALTRRARQVRDMLEEWPCPEAPAAEVPAAEGPS